MPFPLPSTAQTQSMAQPTNDEMYIRVSGGGKKTMAHLGEFGEENM